MNQKEEVAKLAYELTYQRFLLNKDKAHALFSEMDAAEYIVLHLITKSVSGGCPTEEKTYLTDLAHELQMPVSGASHMVGRLKEKGLVLWSHAGKGNEGTFVTITDSGFQAMLRQDRILEAYYSKVIQRFGRERLMQLLQQLKDLESIMDEVYTKEGDNACGNDTTEPVH